MEVFEFADDRRRPPFGKIAALVLLVLGGFLLFRLQSTDDPASSDEVSSPSASADVTSQTTVTTRSDPVTTTGTEAPTVDDPADSAPATAPEDIEPESSVPDASDAPVSTTADTTATPPEDPPSTEAPSATTTPTTAPPATTATPDPVVVTYPVLPDGTPAPVVAIFDTDSITLSGVVFSEEAKFRLEDLARATSKFPDATLISLVTIDPTMPKSVGVRVIELNSVRFPEGSAEIRPDHAAELDRAVGIMNLLPNVSVVVIGHADQRGDPDVNFRLSEQRAVSVTNYLAANGVEPSRMSARAVGQDDLLSVGDSDAALALNRRTEFVFSGLLLDPEN